MVNISGFGTILKAEGLGIKSIAQKVYKNKKGAEYLLNLKNGATAKYEVLKEPGQLTQILTTGNKKVFYTTKKSLLYDIDVFSKKAGTTVTVPQTQSLSYVRDNGAYTYASKYKRTPVDVVEFKDPKTGQIKTKVQNIQELHADKAVSNKIVPTDTYVDVDGSVSQIGERAIAQGKINIPRIWYYS